MGFYTLGEFPSPRLIQPTGELSIVFAPEGEGGSNFLVQRDHFRRPSDGSSLMTDVIYSQ